MNLKLHIFICICCVLVIYIITVYKHSYKDLPLLVVGILSARQNFELRQVARSTWLKNYSPNKKSEVKVWFIVGKDECYIPPEYRLSKYGCEKWNIYKNGLTDYFYTSQEVTNHICVSKEVFRQGFSFKVNHPIIVTELGILFDLLMPNVVTKVALLDIQSKDILVEASIAKNSSTPKNGYLYVDVETVLLPKNYEGMVLVEGFLQKEACEHIQWNDGGGVITFNRIYSTPSHLDSIQFRNDTFSAASIRFLIHDVNSLNDLISKEEEITSQWQSHSKKIDDDLLKETAEKQDILFVDVVDVYRNLPTKLLHFYNWVNKNFEYSFLMKTDDDSVVNIDYLIAHMKNESSFKQNELWIWSRFRKDWPVNYIGKWADYEYMSPIYPVFPCGAAYIMSQKTAKWLSSNKDFLFPYQGEDVSIGIWLSAIKPKFIEDQNFECDSSCNKKSFNRAQLTTAQIKEAWMMYETCQNLCSCD